MTQCNSLNVKLSNSQLNKFKSPIKNETEVVLRLSSIMIGDNETDSSHKLLLNNRHVKLFQNIYQLILSYQRLNYQKWYNQEDFLVDY